MYRSTIGLYGAIIESSCSEISFILIFDFTSFKMLIKLWTSYNFRPSYSNISLSLANEESSPHTFHDQLYQPSRRILYHGTISIMVLNLGLALTLSYLLIHNYSSNADVLFQASNNPEIQTGFIMPDCKTLPYCVTNF